MYALLWSHHFVAAFYAILYNYVYANVKFLCIYQLLNISTCSEERGHVTK